jgi:hypothetical protein
MFRPNVSAPVGLIVMESSGEAPETAQGGAGDDGTLVEIMRRLTGSANVARPGSGAVVARWRLGVARFASVGQGAVVAADCARLTAQLEQAALQLRRTIAIAGRISR